MLTWKNVKKLKIHAIVVKCVNIAWNGVNFFVSFFNFLFIYSVKVFWLQKYENTDCGENPSISKDILT